MASAQEKQRIMILSASAGNGHVRAAQALEKACATDPRVEAVMHVDALQYTGKVFREFYARGYIELAKRAPALWGWAFEETDTPWQNDRTRMFMERANTRPLRREIKAFKPDICICTHFMPSDLISFLMDSGKYHMGLYIAVTDYYVHASWHTHLYTRFFVADDECREQLTRMGLPEERTTVSGIPIDPAFATRPDTTELRKTHNIDESKPVILLSAGALGMSSVDDFGKMLGTISTPSQIIIICGRNEDLKSKLQDLVDRAPNPALDYTILGFTTEIDQWMDIADLFIGKPGGLTTSECLARGLPIVIWDPIPGQEIFNAAFLMENNAGLAPKSALTLGFKIDRLLQDPDRLKAMSNSASALAHPDSATSIIQSILDNPDEPVIKIKKRKPKEFK